MSVHYPPELSALADRPDFEVSLPEVPEPASFSGFRRFAAAAGFFLGTTFAIAVVFFIPVLIFNLSRVEVLEIAGQYVSVSQFLELLGALFWGTFILALALTSFVASLFLSATGKVIRPVSRRKNREDAVAHLTVLRWSGSER